MARQLRKYGYLGLPVVDRERRVLGLITADDVADVAEEEATEDIQKLGGTEALDAPYLSVSFVQMIRKRGAWLSVLFLGEMLTATAMGYFEGEIARAVVLALFVPLIISSGRRMSRPPSIRSVPMRAPRRIESTSAALPASHVACHHSGLIHTGKSSSATSRM